MTEKKDSELEMENNLITEDVEDVEDNDDIENDSEREESDDNEIESEKPESTESVDSLKLYLKEMGGIKMLTREQEVEKAKEIALAESKILDAIMSLPGTPQAIIDKFEAQIEEETPESICFGVIVDNTQDAFDEETMQALELDEEEIEKRVEAIQQRLIHYIEVLRKEVIVNKSIKDGKKNYKRNEEIYELTKELQLDKKLVASIVASITEVSSAVKKANSGCMNIIEKFAPKKRQIMAKKFMKSYLDKDFIFQVISEDYLEDIKANLNKKNIDDPKLARYVGYVRDFREHQKSLLEIENENNITIPVDRKSVV